VHTAKYRKQSARNGDILAGRRERVSVKRRSHSVKKRRNGRALPSAQPPAVEFFGNLADGLGIGLALSDPRGVIRYGNATFHEILDVPS
jgi:hypothetical protein